VKCSIYEHVVFSLLYPLNPIVVTIYNRSAIKIALRAEDHTDVGTAKGLYSVEGIAIYLAFDIQLDVEFQIIS